MSSYKDACLISDVYNLFSPGSSIVAGGYLRDLDLGRQPKDVDVLIEYADMRDTKEAEIQARTLGYNIKRVTNVYRVAEDGDLHTILKLEKGGELSIDLIFLNIPVLQRVEEFPCNLCKIYRKEGGEVVRCPDYLEGIANKRIVYYQPSLQTSYLRKMKEYFPDWEHVL